MRLTAFAACAAAACALVPGTHALARTSSAAARSVQVRATAGASPSASVGAAVARLARAASAHPEPFPDPDQFVAMRMTTTIAVVFARQPRSIVHRAYPTAAQAIVTCHTRLWPSPGRRGAVRAGPAAVRFLSAIDRGLWERAGRPDLTRECLGSSWMPAFGYPLGGPSLGRAALRRIAARPAVVYRRYFTRFGSPAAMLGTLGMQLATIGFPARLRVTVIRAIAAFPGVSVGCAGTGTIALQIRHRPGALSTELVFDAATGALRAIDQRARSGGAFVHGRTMIVRERTRYESRTVTDSAPGRA